MKLYTHLLLFLTFVTIGAVKADTYPEVVFSNSLVGGAYAKSNIEYSGRSWVENVKGNLLVSDTLFYTPGNSLSLKYISQYDGDWTADILYGRQKFYYRVSDKDVLSFKLYVKSEKTKIEDLPKVVVKQKDTVSKSVHLDKYIEEYSYGFWIDVKIPVKDLSGLEYAEPIQSISFLQNGITSGQEDHLYIDQIEFLPNNYPEGRLTSSAILSHAKSYQNHVHLSWRLPLTPSIRYVKIYRSEDNENFQPVGIRPVYMQGCLDYIPEIDKDYYYKVAWVDYDYLESPFSEVIKVTSEKMTNDELLDLVQHTHINYFLENFDINSGMFMPYRMKDKALVSVKETGYAILSLLVGVEKGTANKSLVLNRISKIVYFLMKAQNNDGFFPAYFDGRKGVPDYFEKLADYDVQATASVIEALLIAREYFDEDSAEEKDLRNRITSLWERVNWKEYTHPDYPDLLVKGKGYLSNSKQHEIIGGINQSMNAYFLGMAAPKFPLDYKSFKKGVFYTAEGQEVVLDSMDSSFSILEGFDQIGLENDSSDFSGAMDSMIFKSIYKDSEYYGMKMHWNNYKMDLMDRYTAFMTINPKLIKHNGIRFDDEMAKMILYRKRGDNEKGLGSKSINLWGTYSPKDSLQHSRVNPAISISSIFLLPDLAMQSLEHLYGEYGKELFSDYGFRSWLDLPKNDVADGFQSINQVNITVMIENSRSGFIWNLYQQIPEIKELYGKLFDVNE